MKVEATQTKDVTVELSDSTVKEIVLNKFCEIFDMPSDAYIKNDVLMHNVGYTYPGNWHEEVKIRNATDEDCTAVEALKKLLEEL